MKKHAMRPLWLLCGVVPALACAALRRWQMASAFEGALNLPKPGAPASVVLLCMLAVAAVLLFLLAQRQTEFRAPRGSGESRRPAGMAAKGDSVTLTLTVAAAFLALAAAPVLFLQGMNLREEAQQMLRLGVERVGNNGLLMMVAALTAGLAFAGLFLACRERAAGRPSGKGESMQLLCAVNGCLWLMEVYRGGASDPVLWNYVPMLLAIISGMLFYMDCAGLGCGAFHPRRTLWLAGMTVVLSATAAAGKWELSNGLLLASQTLAALAVLWKLPVNLEHPPVVEEPQDPEEEIQEEDTHV